MFRITAAAAALLLTLTACGGGAAPQPQGQAAAPVNAAFPVTISHKFGQTTVKSEPQRILTVGLTDQDAVLALGKVPVATTEWFGGFPGAVGPWAKDRLGSAALPVVLKDAGTGPPVEKIAALRPDLIVALYAGLTKEQYATLSKFAPVLAQPAGFRDFGIPWQEQTKLVGTALGKAAEADRLVTDVAAKFAQAQRAHPAIVGKSAVVATPYEGFFVYGSQDPRSRTLASLGLKLPADLDTVIGDKFGASISKERGDLLDQDAIVWTVPDPVKDPAKVRADALYKDLKVAKEARDVYLGENDEFGAAFSQVTVLSLPYVIERLAPRLAAAVDGDPATEVEQSAS
ncbi:iron-siderophore ABC transporter substrate-binding protein [Nonomuraea longicatena]|uniref:Iron-siderophore ABC transporter substrate-binding protein n=1 Tax=Nonomuraea longicatena TaxID=83682 RepID=A0ABN1NL83_9ACTN